MPECQSTGVSLLKIGLASALGLPPPPGELATQGVSWWYAPVAPLSATGVEKVEGYQQIRQMADVYRLIPRAKPGLPLDWRKGFGEFLCMVQGHSPDYDRVLQSQQTVLNLLRLTYY